MRKEKVVNDDGLLCVDIVVIEAKTKVSNETFKGIVVWLLVKGSDRLIFTDGRVRDVETFEV